MRKILLVLVCVFALLPLLRPSVPVVHAQTNIINNPDCNLPFNFTTAGNNGTISLATTPVATSAYDNTVNACTSWTLTYQVTGLTGVSIEFDGAPDSNHSPGAFTTWTNLMSGALPLTSTTYGQISGFSFAPWLQVQVNSITGTGQIVGVLQGWRAYNGNASLGSTAITLPGIPYNGQPTLTTGQTESDVPITSRGAVIVNPGIERFVVYPFSFPSVLQLCNAIRTTNCRNSNQ